MVNFNGRQGRILKVSSRHPKLERPNGSFALGSCDNDTTTIYIRNTVSDWKLKHILAHELTHAAIFSYDIHLDSQEEELIADLVGTYGEEIIQATNSIFKRIKKIRE